MTLKRRKDTPPHEVEQEPQGGLGAFARRLASQAGADPRVQDVTRSLRHRADEVRANLKDRADQHLEGLMASRQTSDETQAMLDQRRQERDLRAGQLRARRDLLALADTPQQKRVLLLLADTTPWAGGTAQQPRYTYTRLLDSLAPGGSAEEEMAVHRAIWSLAERQVLSVSPFGEVKACPPGVEGRILSAPISTTAITEREP